jgi:hypothetical protein
MSAIGDYKKKIGVFERSYQEVLAALKHQDEKLNRTLTALAFLTVAGVALFPKITGSGIVFNDAGPGASAVLFAVFLIAVAISVIVTLTAIGPGRPLPKPPSQEARAQRKSSLLYYARISRDEQWQKRLEEPPEALMKELASNFHSEAQLIASRIDYKVTRAREANTWVQLAIVALALMGIFGASGLSSSARWWIAAALILAVLAAPLWDLRVMRETDFIRSGDFSISGYAMLGAIVVAAAGLLVAGQLIDTQWQALGYCAVAFIVPRYAIVQSRAAQALMIAGLVAIVPALMLTIFLAP